MNSENLILLANILLVTFVVLLIPMIIWVYVAKPPRHTIKKYPSRIVYMSRLPFTTAWKKAIAAGDVVLFEKYQTRLNVFVIFLLVISHLISASFYVNEVRMYLECMTDTVSRTP